jgi:predicted oxidoreductase
MKNLSISDNLAMSRISAGFWRAAKWNYSKSELNTFIHKLLELGVDTFDHADIYGSYTCEALFGEAVKDEPLLRERMKIVTKCGIKLVSPQRPENTFHCYDTSKSHILYSVDQSLKNLATDYIDVLLIHRPDPFMNPAEVAEAFTILKKSGKVLNFGVSNFLPSQYSLLQNYLDFPLVTNQVEFSAKNFECLEDGTIDYAMERGIVPMSWSPYGGGDIFTSDEQKFVRLRDTLKEIGEKHEAHGIDQIALAWVLNHPANFIAVLGSGKIERYESAIKALDIQLSREDWFKIWTASKGYEVP